MISNIEPSIKAELDPIRDLVLRLPTNAPSVVQKFREGRKGGVGSSKASGENFGVVVGKVITTQITTIISTKPISSSSITTTTTTTTTTRTLTNGVSINKDIGGLSSIPIKSTSSVDPKDKGKSISVV